MCDEAEKGLDMQGCGGKKTKPRYKNCTFEIQQINEIMALGSLAPFLTSGVRQLFVSGHN